MDNVETLKEELISELMWRYKELKNIKELYLANVEKQPIGKSDKLVLRSTKKSSYILRSSIPMIYAHWEGFFKKSIQLQNSFLDTCEIRYNNLHNRLLILLVRDKHNNGKDYIFKFKDIKINTESNLSWKVIEKFSKDYNFSLKLYAKHKNTLEKLLKIRNGISHGENAYHFQNFNDIEEYLLVAIKLMILTKNMVLNFVSYDLYKKDKIRRKC